MSHIPNIIEDLEVCQDPLFRVIQIMRRNLNFFLIIIVIISLTGCALMKNPFKAWTKAENKVEQVEKKIDTNQDKIINEGKKYIYATKLTLDLDPSTNQFHLLESQFAEKAIVVMGQPTLEDVNILRQMIQNLLSTNAQLNVKGQKQMAAMDAEIIDLQNENEDLISKLEKAQAKVTAVGLENAGMAQKWSNLAKIFWWSVYIILGFIVIRVITMFLPPPYNSIGIIVSLPVSIITGLLHGFAPEAKALSGVVSKEYKDVSGQLLTAIQAIKNAHPELHTEISNTIANTVDTHLIPTVNSTKADLKIVS
jgi:hypothetical protein